MYHQEVIQSQSDALSRFENHKDKQQKQMLEELESAAVATAIASSEFDETFRRDIEQVESENVASMLHSEELSAADRELANALESSERELHEASDFLAKTILGFHQASGFLVKTVFGKKGTESERRHEASWECRKCTFTNEPYRRQCAMCEKAAPPGVVVFSNLAPIRFELEIEVVVGQGQGGGYTFEAIAASLTNMGTRVDFVGHTHETSSHWKIVTDSSLQGESDNLCFALMSPVLLGEEGLGQFRAVMENVRKLGISTDATNGFHVSVDATPSEATTRGMGALEGLKRVAQCFVALENALDLLVALTWKESDENNSPSNRPACRSNRLGLGTLSNRQRWDTIDTACSVEELVDMMNPNSHRHMKLNMTSLVMDPQNPRCEFRQHGGTMEILEAEAWVRLVLRFCQRASLFCPASGKCLFREGASSEVELAALFDLVNCCGLEQFYMELSTKHVS